MLQLSDLTPDSFARLVSLEGDRSFQRRLMEMGFLPGTRVHMIRRVPLGGLIELEVRCCRVTLRLSEAARVQVALG
jgi:Fe2+ transport system protein FeoA